MYTFRTRYSDLTDSQVNELFREETWSSLDPSRRLDALQELEVRTALACGNRPCEVRTEDMNGYLFGGYADDEIVLNRHLVEEGGFVTDFGNGEVVFDRVDGLNAQMMDTIHHENYHAYQDQVIHGEIRHSDAAEAELWAANWPSEQYIDCNDPSGCYRIQSLERTAFAHGEACTKEAFAEIEAKYGQDHGYRDYLEDIQRYSYDDALDDAIDISGDEHIRDTLDGQMLEAYHASRQEHLDGDADTYSRGIESQTAGEEDTNANTDGDTDSLSSTYADDDGMDLCM